MGIQIPFSLRQFQPTEFGFDADGNPYKPEAVYCITDPMRNTLIARYIGENEHGQHLVSVITKRSDQFEPIPDEGVLCIGLRCRVERV